MNQPNKGKTVLIADDDAGTRRVLGLRLERAGYTVKTAAGGHEALAEFRECRPGVVILDANMPDLNGFEVCRQIKDDEENKGAKVVFVSGASTPSASYVQRCAEVVGGDLFLQKPFDGKQLVEWLAQVGS
jgi:CheY-like chemotaxis protein